MIELNYILTNFPDAFEFIKKMENTDYHKTLYEIITLANSVTVFPQLENNAKKTIAFAEEFKSIFEALDKSVSLTNSDYFNKLKVARYYKDKYTTILKNTRTDFTLNHIKPFHLGEILSHKDFLKQIEEYGTEYKNDAPLDFTYNMFADFFSKQPCNFEGIISENGDFYPLDRKTFSEHEILAKSLIDAKKIEGNHYLKVGLLFVRTNNGLPIIRLCDSTDENNTNLTLTPEMSKAMYNIFNNLNPEIPFEETIAKNVYNIGFTQTNSLFTGKTNIENSRPNPQAKENLSVINCAISPIDFDENYVLCCLNDGVDNTRIDAYSEYR